MQNRKMTLWPNCWPYIPNFQIWQVKGEITFNNNNKWKSLWLLNSIVPPFWIFMTCYGSRYCLEENDPVIQYLLYNFASCAREKLKEHDYNRV